MVTKYTLHTASLKNTNSTTMIRLSHTIKPSLELKNSSLHYLFDYVRPEKLSLVIKENDPTAQFLFNLIDYSEMESMHRLEYIVISATLEILRHKLFIATSYSR